MIFSDRLCGRFIVVRAAAGSDPRWPWCVESEKARERIFTRTKTAAIRIAADGADGCGLDKWRWHFERAARREVAQ